PLWSQFWTASRLNVSSNLRRTFTAIVFMGLWVHCSPNSPSVKSAQPQCSLEISLAAPPSALCPPPTDLWFPAPAISIEHRSFN
ncbi:MAG TPA: hypothetical protein VJT54_07190, partial [Verrucomicrobiae bacterium]|nr:hypothetical protein [Verrucomicrobiae bacterium]